MAVSSDGKHLAAGDSDGNLHIFNLYTSDYTCIQDVHEGDVLSLNFSVPVRNRVNSSIVDLESYYFLASSGRDKMIHLFDVNRNFYPIASINDHSASVSLVKLTGNGRRIISCGSDRSLIFHDVAGSNKGYAISHPHQQKASHGSIYDIAIDLKAETAVTVGQDKKINILDIAAGQVIRSFKQGGDFGDPTKVCLDPSCSYVVCSYSDRSICMYDFTSGEMVARATGHGEAINGIIFLPDCKHLVSVGSGGCIFVWKVPSFLTSRMSQRIKENSCPLSPNAISQCTAVDRIKYYEENYLRSQSTGTAVLQGTPTFRFSVSRLPQWAKSKVTSPFVIPMNPIPSEVARLEDHSPSKSIRVENAPVNLSLHMPSIHNPRLSRSSSDPNYSKDSTTQGTCRSFALDKRWFTIHTVCLDLLSSPEVSNVKEQMVPLSSDLPQSPALEETKIKLMKHSPMNPSVTKFSLNTTSDNSNCDVGQSAHINVDESNESGCLRHQHWLKDASALREELSRENLKQLQFSTSVDQVAADNCILNSGNNSVISKPKIEPPKSSARKSYSARFNVRRDLVRAQTLVLDSPVIDFCETTNRTKETSLTNIAPSSVIKPEISGRGSSNQQSTMSSNSPPQDLLSRNNIASQSNSSSSSSKSTEVKTIKITEEQEVCDKDIFSACKEALRSLEASSKTALEVFSRLRDITSTRDNNPEASETQFYAEAAEMLPSIAKNVYDICKFMWSR